MKRKLKQTKMKNEMPTVIQHYYCYKSIAIGKGNYTEIYFYSGNLIKKSNKRKPFADLKRPCQNDIKLKLNNLRNLNFDLWNSGVSCGKFITIFSATETEVFEVALDLDSYNPKFNDKQIIGQILNAEKENLRSDAVCILQEQTFKGN